jgi:hypothetical protein
MCLADFDSMGTHNSPKENIEPEFAAEEISDTELEPFRVPKPK